MVILSLKLIFGRVRYPVGFSTMSKQKNPKRRKRKTGYINFVKHNGFTVEFTNFKDFAEYTKVPKGTAVE